MLPIKNRREFLRDCALAGSTVMLLKGAETRDVRIEASSEATFHRRLAERELLRGLTNLRLPGEVRFTTAGAPQSGSELTFRLRLEPDRFKDKEAYSISADEHIVTFSAATDRGLLHSVFGFLEQQGAYFGIDGENYPPDAAGALILPSENQPWTSTPRFSVRGLLPWPDFLNCITVFNDEDFRAYFEAMLRMRFNMFGMHVYSSPESESAGTESYLSFEFAGVSHLGYLDNSASQRWGYLPERTSRYGMGGAQFFSGEVFGSDATTLGRNIFEIAERTRGLLARSLSYAKQLGMSTGIGFEPYQLPEATLRALPPEIKPKPDKPFPGKAKYDVESFVSRRLLEARLGELLDAYPEVDYVWLWEDEDMNWESRKTGVPLSVTPFQQAYDFLKRNAPRKRMVLSGWGGVVRHFKYFHQKLPRDIVFSALNDSLGWDPVSQEFGELEDRERWPIPWLEDDPGMWLPQFHVNRTQRDVKLAARYGCQGMLGIHWRHRIMDATAGYLAKATWDETLTPAAHFGEYGRSQASGDRGSRLGEILNDADLHQKVLHTGTSQVQDGHVVTREWAADYDQGFLYWRDYEPEKEVVESQKELAGALNEIAEKSASPLERERTGYLAGFVNFTVPYTDAWVIAHRLNAILDAASKLKASGKEDEARQKIAHEGVPLYIELAPLVRDTMLRYQDIVATRNDLGQLASMHNKFVRLALVRLQLSIQEYLNDVPADIQNSLKQALQPDSRHQARIFVPTRPGILRNGECFRIMIVAPGSLPVENVSLHTRMQKEANWSHTPAKLVGRRTYEATIGPFDPAKTLAAYYVSALIGGAEQVDPPSAPHASYLVTLA